MAFISHRSIKNGHHNEISDRLTSRCFSISKTYQVLQRLPRTPYHLIIEGEDDLASFLCDCVPGLF